MPRKKKLSRKAKKRLSAKKAGRTRSELARLKRDDSILTLHLNGMTPAQIAIQTHQRLATVRTILTRALGAAQGTHHTPLFVGSPIPDVIDFVSEKIGDFLADKKVIPSKQEVGLFLDSLRQAVKTLSEGFRLKSSGLPRGDFKQRFPRRAE